MRTPAKTPAKPPFETVVRTHGRTVLRICRTALGPVDADDAWSETFLSALRAYPELPHEANLEAWLVRIARNKVIDLVRARARAPVPSEQLPVDQAARGSDGGPSGGPGGGPGGGPDWQDLELWNAVDGLPPRQREAVVEHHLAGVPFVEIAERTGRRPEAVRRAAADGIAALRRGRTR